MNIRTLLQRLQFTPGWKVKILVKEGDWLKVKRLDGKMGWVREDAVERI